MRSSCRRAGLVALCVAVSAGLLAVPMSVVGTVPPAQAAGEVPNFDHIVVIMMENHSYSEIINNPAAPYYNSLANQYGLANQYFGVRHPSLPNYLSFTGGTTAGITTDCNTCFLNAPNLAVDRIEASGRTWKGYLESMPAPCTLGDTGQYIQHHNPFVYYDNIRTVPAECAKVVPYTALASDFASIATTPNYSLIAPNVCNDMHNCSIATGDAWLQSNVGSILASPAFTTQNSLLVLSFDEDDGTEANRVPTVLVGSSVRPGARSNVHYDHYSLLKTIESAWGLAPLTTNDANASVMSDFFTPASVLATDAFTRTVSGGWGSADVGGPWTLSGTASSFGVNGSAGTISLNAGGGMSARLLGVTASNVDLTARTTFDKVPTGGGVYAGFVARRISSGNEYRIRLHVTATKTMALSLSKVVGGTETVLVTDRVIGGLTFNVGTLYDLRVQLYGTNPTAIQAHAWVDGTTEPVSWPLATTDATAVLQAPGANGLWSLLTASSTTAPTLVTFDDLAVTVSSPPPPPVLASDSFTRTLSGSWGAADVGGSWTLGGAASAFGVNGSAGSITFNAGGGNSARLLGAVATDVDLSMRTSPDKVPTGSGDYSALIVRRVSSGNEYRARLHFLVNGTLALSLSKVIGGAETVLVTDNVVAGLTFTLGASYDIRVQVSGTNPTTVQARAWLDGTTEPSTWTFNTTDATAALQAPGAIGVWAFLSANSTNAPVTISVDNFVTA
jgi:hypothetical protein